MNCDVELLMCTVSLGSIALVLMLGFFGISITLYGLAGDLLEWYEEQDSAIIAKVVGWWKSGRET